jgi:hypothetical protein
VAAGAGGATFGAEPVAILVTPGVNFLAKGEVRSVELLVVEAVFLSPAGGGATGAGGAGAGDAGELAVKGR